MALSDMTRPRLQRTAQSDRIWMCNRNGTLEAQLGAAGAASAAGAAGATEVGTRDVTKLRSKKAALGMVV